MAVLLHPSVKFGNLVHCMSKKDKNAVAEEEVSSKETSKKTKESKKEKKVDPLTKVQLDLEQEKDRYLRLFAEFENYKRRTGKERIDLFKTASQDVMVSLLPILDDFDRALKEIDKAKDDTLFTGVELISSKLKETLRAKGLEPIATEQGEVFNADDHEAVTQIPAPSKDLKGKIIEVVETGYMLGDKIIRYPKVVIGQ